MTTLFDARTGEVIAEDYGAQWLCLREPLEYNGVKYLTLSIYGMGNWGVNVIPWDHARMRLIDFGNGKEIGKVPLPESARGHKGETIEVDDVTYRIRAVGSFGYSRSDDCVYLVYVESEASAA